MDFSAHITRYLRDRVRITRLPFHSACNVSLPPRKKCSLFAEACRRSTCFARWVKIRVRPSSSLKKTPASTTAEKSPAQVTHNFRNAVKNCIVRVVRGFKCSKRTHGCRIGSSPPLTLLIRLSVLWTVKFLGPTARLKSNKTHRT